jgi:hypothetical protein
MLDGNATGFGREASHITLEHRVVLAEANAHFSQHSLNEFLLGEEALIPVSSQLSYIARQAHQRFAQAAVRFKGQRDKQVLRRSLAPVLAVLLFVAVGRSGASCVCRIAAEGAGAWLNNGNFSNLQGAVGLEENVSPSFGMTCGLRWWPLPWWLLRPESFVHSL